jgi:F-type H+-transporting ATPase subunit gamma
MEAAESRIEERLGRLEDRLNRQRQQAITEELLEVVSGFRALEEEDEAEEQEEEGEAGR